MADGWEMASLFIVLTDDDLDDRELFADVVNEIHSSISLQTFEDGEQLMEVLTTPGTILPDIIFLDLNMHKKGGRECLYEIRHHDQLKNIPVVIYSTSSNPKDIQYTYSTGANLYVRKPNTYPSLVLLIKNIFLLDWNKHRPNAAIEHFVYAPD
jgi:CheY-like chemotaxis protein